MNKILPDDCLEVSLFNFSEIDGFDDDSSFSIVDALGLGYGKLFILLNRSLISAKLGLSILFSNLNCI
jgi:hypothetical protein